MLVLRRMRTPKLPSPPPWADADPAVVVAVTRLPLMVLSLMVIWLKAAVWMPPPRTRATPVDDRAAAVFALNRVWLIVASTLISAPPESTSARPVVVVAAAWLSLIMLSVRTSGPLVCRPPENAAASPMVLVALTELAVMLVRWIVADAFSWMWMPPPDVLCAIPLGSAS